MSVCDSLVAGRSSRRLILHFRGPFFFLRFFLLRFFLLRFFLLRFFFGASAGAESRAPFLLRLLCTALLRSECIKTSKIECGDCVNMIQPVVLVMIVLLVAGNNIVHGGSCCAQFDPNQGLEWNNSRCKSTVSLEWNNQGLETIKDWRQV